MTVMGTMKFVGPCTTSLLTDVLANLTRPPSSFGPVVYHQGVRTFAKAAAKAPAAAAKRPALPCNLHGVYGTYVLYQSVGTPPMKLAMGLFIGTARAEGEGASKKKRARGSSDATPGH